MVTKIEFLKRVKIKYEKHVANDLAVGLCGCGNVVANDIPDPWDMELNKWFRGLVMEVYRSTGVSYYSSGRISRTRRMYYWPVDDTKSRLEWLDGQIKKLENS